MSLEIRVEPAPLKVERDGVVRVGGTRVTLDTIVYAFRQGATAEEILQRYPSLDLADIYAAIGYYLHYPADVEGYLAVREEQAKRVREEIETWSDMKGFRQRLLARRGSSAVTPDDSSRG